MGIKLDCCPCIYGSVEVESSENNIERLCSLNAHSIQCVHFCQTKENIETKSSACRF